MLRIVAVIVLMATTLFAQDGPTPLEAALAELAAAKAKVDTLMAQDLVASQLEAIGASVPQALEAGLVLQPYYGDPLYVEMAVSYYGASDADQEKWREVRLSVREMISRGVVELGPWRWAVHRSNVLPVAGLVYNAFYVQPEVTQ